MNKLDGSYGMTNGLFIWLYIGKIAMENNNFDLNQTLHTDILHIVLILGSEIGMKERFKIIEV